MALRAHKSTQRAVRQHAQPVLHAMAAHTKLAKTPKPIKTNKNELRFERMAPYLFVLMILCAFFDFQTKCSHKQGEQKKVKTQGSGAPPARRDPPTPVILFAFGFVV